MVAPGIAVLDVMGLAPELERMVAAARAETTEHADAILRRARAILELARMAPSQPASEDNVANGCGRWRALHLQHDQEEHVLCWEESDDAPAVTAQGVWSGEACSSVLAMIDGRALQWRMTEGEEAVFDSEDVGREGPGGENCDAGDERRRKEAMSASKETDDSNAGQWVCSSCSRTNSDSDVLCEGCNTPKADSGVPPWPGAPISEDYMSSHPFYAAFPKVDDKPAESLKVTDAAFQFLENVSENDWFKLLERAGEALSSVGQCISCKQPVSQKARFCEACGADQEAGLKSARKGRKTAGQASAEKVRAQEPTSEKAQPARRKSQKPTDLPE